MNDDRSRIRTAKEKIGLHHGRMIRSWSPRPPSEWPAAPDGLPGWRLTMANCDQADGYGWYGLKTSRYEAGRRLLRVRK